MRLPTGALSAKVLRDLWLNPWRTLLMVGIVGLSTASFGALLASEEVVKRTEQEQVQGVSPAHAVLTIPDFGDTLILMVEQVEGVVRAEARRVVSTRWQTASGRWVPLELFSVANFEDWKINRVYPEGPFPRPLLRGDVLLEGSARSIGPIGEQVSLQTIEGARINLRVAGFVQDPTTLQYPLTRRAYGIVSSQTMEDLGEPSAYNRLHVLTHAGERASIERILTSVQETLEREGYGALRSEIPAPGKTLRTDRLAAVLFLLSRIGFLTLCLGGLVIGNVMAAGMAGQQPQIGILKTLGGRPGQIAGLYARQALLYGLPAIGVAIPLGRVLGGEVSRVIADSNNFLLPRFWLPPGVWALQIGSALALPILAAAFPILRGTRKSVLESLAEPSAIGSRTNRPRTFLARVTRGPGFVRMAVRNSFRRKGRVLLTLGMLSLAGGMFVAVLGARQALQTDLVKIQRTVDYDVSITLLSPESQDSLIRRAQSIQGVIDTEAWLSSEARIVMPDRLTSGVTVLGVPTDSTMTHPTVVQGRWLMPQDEFAVFFSSDVLELSPGLKAGDHIVLRIGQRVDEWTVVGLEARQLRPTAMVPLETLQRVTGLNGLALSVVVRTTDRSPGFQEMVESDLRSAFIESTIAGTRTTAEERISQAAQLDLLLWLLMVVVVLVLVVAGLGLGVTMVLNVMERTREIGVLRALGARDRFIRGLVTCEGLFLGLLSWGLGAAGAIPLGVWLTRALGTILYGRPVEPTYSGIGTILWLGIILAVVTVASLVPAQQALRVPVREALTYPG